MTRTRKPRRKATTELGRTIMQRERQRLVREQADLAKKLAEDAAAARRHTLNKTKPNPRRDTDVAIQRSIVQRVAGVLASEGINVHIVTKPVEDERHIDAWTDFQQIYVGYHIYDDVKQTAAIMRGAFYHEGGHCRFTVPFPQLEEMVATERGTIVQTLRDWHRNKGVEVGEMQRAWNSLEDQRMETAVVSDSPRKAGYFVPMILAELCTTVDMAASNWPLLVWRRYLPSKIIEGARRLFVTRHGAEGEQHAQEIEAIVDRYVQSEDATEMYACVYDMALMYKVIQPLAFDLSDAGHRRQQRNTGTVNPDALQIPISPEMLKQIEEAQAEQDDEDEDEGEDEDEIDWYHIFDILSNVMLSPEKLVTIQYVIPRAAQPESDDKGQGSGSPSPHPMPSDDDDNSEDDDDSGDGKGAGRDQTKEDDDRQDDRQDDEESEGDTGDVSDDHGSEHHQAPGGHTGTHGSDDADLEEDEDDLDDEGLSQDDLDEALAEAEEERMQDRTLDQDVQAFQDARADTASKLSPYVGGVNTDVMALAEANNLATDLERAFDAATVDMMPSWHEQQRRGILNPLRYETRQPGDVEFFRGFVDNGNPGHDIAVSVLLDYSGSMCGVTKELSQVAFACKRACDNLTIPCTVVLWDTSARTLWDASERAEHLPLIRATGGTNPSEALADIPNHEYGKTKHIVLIMTDDAWDTSAPHLGAFRQEGRIIIGLGYGMYSAEGIAASMERRGADFGYALSALSEIPKHLESALRMAV